MSKEIKLSPMKWGNCPKCGCDMDLYNPVQLIIKNTEIPDPGQSTLLKLACSLCDYALYQKFVNLQDYR